MNLDLNVIFGGASVVLGLISIVPYIIGILKAQVRPHLFTWLVWTIIVGVGFAAQISDGAGAGAWVSCVAGLCCATITVLSLKYGEKNITRSDWAAFIFALSAIPLWILTDNPLWSVILVCIIDGVAFIPTIRKSITKPFEENLSTYALGAASYVLGLIAIDNFTLITALYPAVIVILNLTFVFMALWRRSVLRHA